MSENTNTNTGLNEDGQPLKDPWAMPTFRQCIELADGTVMDGFAVAYDESEELWVKLTSRRLSFDDVYAAFSNPEKTSKIISNTSILTTEEFYGYTKLTLIQQNGRTMSVRLKLAK